jgi:ribosomal protein S18 acetylase RimI-like enzyme
MSLPDDLELRDATTDDLAAIAALRESVGWPVHGWALRAVVASSWARCVVVVDQAGTVVAVGSGAAYGRLGFVGNMVVHESQRRRGVGAHVLRTVLASLEEAGTTRVELFATAAGRPLYERHGFRLVGPGAMVELPRAAGADDPALTVRAVGGGEVNAVIAYDTPRFGGDRGQLLSLLSHHDDHPMLAARRDGEIAGYAWVRPPDGRIGPFVADDPSVAAALLHHAFALLPAVETLTTSLPMANRPAVAWTERLGIDLDPWDGRMALGPEIERRIETIYGNTVGALG